MNDFLKVLYQKRRCNGLHRGFRWSAIEKSDKLKHQKFSLWYAQKNYSI